MAERENKPRIKRKAKPRLTRQQEIRAERQRRQLDYDRQHRGGFDRGIR